MKTTMRLLLGVSWILFSAFLILVARPETQSAKWLTLRLLLPTPKSCVGAGHIDGEVAIRNTGAESIIVPLTGVGSSIQFSAYSAGDKLSPGFETLDIRADPWPTGSRPPKQIILRPGESYWVNVNFALEKDFFSKPGIYDVRIDLTAAESDTPKDAFSGSLESNWVYFELEDCSRHKTK